MNVEKRGKGKAPPRREPESLVVLERREGGRDTKGLREDLGILSIP